MVFLSLMEQEVQVKQFFYKALLAQVKSRRLIALAITTSGVAVVILPGVEQHIHDLFYH